VASLKLVKRQSRVHPRGGFGIAWTGSAHSQLHRLDRSREIAFEPAHVRRASVRAKVGFQIHHALICLNRIAQFPLLHQRIAQKTIVKAESSLMDETACQHFGFFKAMQILKHVRTQQRRLLALRIALFDRARALLGQFVKTRVETFARLRNKRPAELFEAGLKTPSVANLLLEPGNFLVGTAIAGVRR
jgi:hypothetical protein